jgi:hypothetical protein
MAVFKTCSGLLVKLMNDAPKYKGKILKEPLLIVYNEMYLTRNTRSNAFRKLNRLLGQREKIQENVVQLAECNKSFWAECNKRQNPPTLVPANVLGRHTCISSHQLHRTNEPGILSMHIHPSKDVVANLPLVVLIPMQCSLIGRLWSNFLHAYWSLKENHFEIC